MKSPIQYFDADGNLKNFIVPSSSMSMALNEKITELETELAELEKIISGLQAYTESE